MRIAVEVSTGISASGPWKTYATSGVPGKAEWIWSRGSGSAHHAQRRGGNNPDLGWEQHLAQGTLKLASFSVARKGVKIDDPKHLRMLGAGSPGQTRLPAPSCDQGPIAHPSCIGDVPTSQLRTSQRRSSIHRASGRSPCSRARACAAWMRLPRSRSCGGKAYSRDEHDDHECNQRAAIGLHMCTLAQACIMLELY